jgi:hypothetical protein
MIFSKIYYFKLYVNFMHNKYTIYLHTITFFYFIYENSLAEINVALDNNNITCNDKILREYFKVINLNIISVKNAGKLK